MTQGQQTESTPLVDPACYAAATAAIRAEAVRLLEAGEVTAVVGYRAGRRAGSAMPEVATTAEAAAQLIFTPGCQNNLALFLSKAKREALPKGKVAVVVKGCDLRALAGLIGESQLKRDEVHVIGVACPGVYGAGADLAKPLAAESLARKCRECKVHLPEGTDVVAGTLPPLPDLAPLEAEELARLEAMTPQERWAFWTEQFARCIRCLACRQVCPFCFCTQCLCDRNRPQAVDTSPRPAGNTAWHIVRAMHLAGRCAGCAECERVCPMDIPLNLLNRKMAQELFELYGFETTMQPQEQGALTSYRDGDDQSFIK
ncbi:MAG: Fe-S oxidoreductase [Deltaproteobacteria bacterium]|nr:MAG: Fe-S oxidoreductase [Deltaproteobacteria bacterium]